MVRGSGAIQTLVVTALAVLPLVSSCAGDGAASAGAGGLGGGGLGGPGGGLGGAGGGIGGASGGLGGVEGGLGGAGGAAASGAIVQECTDLCSVELQVDCVPQTMADCVIACVGNTTACVAEMETLNKCIVTIGPSSLECNQVIGLRSLKTGFCTSEGNSLISCLQM